MKPRLLLLALGLVLLVPLRADGNFGQDRDGRPRPGAARVILYSGENFDGVYVELLPGAAVANLNDLCFSDGRKVNDRISSVRVIGGLKVSLYEHPEFSGASLELDDNVARLSRVPKRSGGHWDNCLTSVRVSGGRPERDGDGRRGDRDGEEWRGRGRDRERDRPHGDRDPSVADVERMVTRAYRELLDRAPNAAELRHYREAVFIEGWDRDALHDDLRASREYRTKEAGRIVERVYRDLLGREPDPSGRAHWGRKIVDQGWTEGRLRDEIRKSDEYRNRR